MPLSVASLNILSDTTLWGERSRLVLEGFGIWRPHVIALQEVSQEADNAHWLAEQLGDYSTHLCPALDHPASDSLALLTRIPVTDHQTLSLGHEGRQAHRISVEHEGTSWVVANTHLYWNPLRESIRVGQAERLVDWLQPCRRLVLCGDFNARQQARSQLTLNNRLVSAYEYVHGDHPAYTYPTDLRRGPGLRHRLRSGFFRVAGWVLLRRDEPWRQTVDHIFVDDTVDALSCRLIFDRPSSSDTLLYASDHVGLLAEVRARTVSWERRGVAQ